MINFYLVYRLILLGFTLYGVFNFIIVLIKLLKYKEYYDKVPNFLKNYFAKKGTVIVENQFNQQKQPILTNAILLLILIILNFILLIY